MFDPRVFFHPSFLFDLTPPPLTSVSERFLPVVFSVLILTGIVLWIRSRRMHKAVGPKRKRFLRIGRAAVTFGLIGLFLFFFSFEQVRLLGARFWYVLWLLFVFAWGAFLWWTTFRKRPYQESETGIRKEREKYLPKPRRRRS